MQNYRLKIKDLPEIKDEIGRLRTLGKRIVFTNGCFDILHPGHTRYLSSARELGDYLLVAVNSDSSIKTIKGLVLSSWEKNRDSLILDIEIPFNSKARVYIPKIKKVPDKIIIKEIKKILWKDNKYNGGVKGIIDWEEENNYIIFDVGSGKYCFKIT